MTKKIINIYYQTERNVTGSESVYIIKELGVLEPISSRENLKDSAQKLLDERRLHTLEIENRVPENKEELVLGPSYDILRRPLNDQEMKDLTKHLGFNSQ